MAVGSALGHEVAEEAQPGILIWGDDDDQAA
jgi:hypothetical protein